MPLTIKHGSIFDSTAQVLVCPVNCVGVMGKGLALEFKRRYLEESKHYMWICENDALRPGELYVCGKIIYAATKLHWMEGSKIKWVDACLSSIEAYAFPAVSIAIPQLGCGCGGLDWADVWPLYEKHLGELDCNVEVWIYE